MNVVCASSDADTLVARQALNVAKQAKSGLVVYADDTDILALLVRHRTQEVSNIAFSSDAHGRGKQRSDGKRISVKALQEKLRGNACKNKLVIHAFGRCDTTSAIYGIGKRTVFQRLMTNVSASDHLDSMRKSGASVHEIKTAGASLMSVSYGGEPGDTLGHLRHHADVFKTSDLEQDADVTSDTDEFNLPDFLIDDDLPMDADEDVYDDGDYEETVASEFIPTHFWGPIWHYIL
jgi:hypothetical protein